MPKNADPHDLCQDVRMSCNFITDQMEEPYLYPLHFEGQKSANFGVIFRGLQHFQAL